VDTWVPDGFDEAELERRIRACRDSGAAPVPVRSVEDLSDQVAARRALRRCWVLAADGTQERRDLGVGAETWWATSTVVVALDYSWAVTAGPGGTRWFLALEP
jgi:hypothetical protein